MSSVQRQSADSIAAANQWYQELCPIYCLKESRSAVNGKSENPASREHDVVNDQDLVSRLAKMWKLQRQDNRECLVSCSHEKCCWYIARKLAREACPLIPRILQVNIRCLTPPRLCLWEI